jgi:hypothetical protein
MPEFILLEAVLCRKKQGLRMYFEQGLLLQEQQAAKNESQRVA